MSTPKTTRSKKAAPAPVVPVTNNEELTTVETIVLEALPPKPLGITAPEVIEKTGLDELPVRTALNELSRKGRALFSDGKWCDKRIMKNTPAPVAAPTDAPTNTEVELEDMAGKVLEALNTEPQNLEQVVEALGGDMTAGAVNSNLVLLELRGHAKRLPGNVFIRIGGPVTEATPEAAPVEEAEAPVMDGAQALLFDTAEEELVSEFMLLDSNQLPADSELVGDAPTPAFCLTVQMIGVQTPIWVQKPKIPGQPYKVIAGRRRIKAARKADKFPIRALVYDASAKMGAILTLLENQRTDNMASDIIAMRQLMESGATIDQVCEGCGITRDTFAQREKIMMLEPDLLRAYLDGKMQTTVAQSAAKLNKTQQVALVEKLNAPAPPPEKGKKKAKAGIITAKDVSAVKKASTDAAVSELPVELFDTPTQGERNWQSVSKEWLTKVLQVIPAAFESCRDAVAAAAMEIEGTTHGDFKSYGSDNAGVDEAREDADLRHLPEYSDDGERNDASATVAA